MISLLLLVAIQAGISAASAPVVQVTPVVIAKATTTPVVAPKKVVTASGKQIVKLPPILIQVPTSSMELDIPSGTLYSPEPVVGGASQPDQPAPQQPVLIAQPIQITLPPTMPEPTVSQPEPQAAPVSQARLEIFSPLAGKGLGREYVALRDGYNPQDPAEHYDESNYIVIGLVIYDDNGNIGTDRTVPVTVTATDGSQNKTMNGTGVMLGQANGSIPGGTFYYSYSYDFKSSGQHTITFQARGMSKAVTLSVKPSPYNQ